MCIYVFCYRSAKRQNTAIVSLSRYTYIYIFIHVFVNIHTYIYIYICIYYIHIYIYSCTYINTLYHRSAQKPEKTRKHQSGTTHTIALRTARTHPNLYMYTFVFIFMYTYTYIHTHICIYICISYICIYIYIYIYIYINVFIYIYITGAQRGRAQHAEISLARCTPTLCEPTSVAGI